MRPTTPGLAVLVALSMGIAGCSAPPESDTAQAPGLSATASPSGTSTPPAASPVASPPTASGTPSMPPEPEDPIAAAAWKALMGPDGEYAAAATYQAVIDRYGQVEPYVSIKEAEERHIDALVRQLQRQGVEVPDNPYTDQVSAPRDLESAARAWADGEVLNIAMYDELLDDVQSDPRLTRVFSNLQRASEEQHLPAFQAAAESGGTLTPEQMAANDLTMHRTG